MTRKHSIPALNMSYVLTSSNDFKATLDGVVKGLNGAGFSEKDYRVGEVPVESIPQPTYQQETLPETQPDTSAGNEKEDFLDFDPASLRRDIQTRAETAATPADAMLQNAEKEQAAL